MRKPQKNWECQWRIIITNINSQRHSTSESSERRSNMSNLFDTGVSIEKMAAYLDGNVYSEEAQKISSLISSNDDLKQFVESNDAIDEGIEEFYSLGGEMPEEISNLDFDLPDVSVGDEISEASDILSEDSDSLPVNHSQTENNMEENSPVFKALTVDDIQQEFPDTCAIKSQQIILESHDINVSEQDLVEESIDKGWYVPGQGGTMPEDVGNLLEEHGMTVNHFENATIDDIASELAKGHQVIVGVDSGELWQPGHFETFEDFFKLGGADHALIVSGIQVNPLTSEREVILTDPGTGEVAHTYTIDQFEDAWDDSDNFMISSDI